jgi:hypothetical protein
MDWNKLLDDKIIPGIDLKILNWIDH